ncbi:MAG: UDP-N-acetylglucosamine--N-acetylmuramyl-(pentapeptide) pyrophosphoryl-undecaprenol N-acetylglucosamine transferase [Rhodobacter sp.]|nr:UDP-N-acetylglucosamine--N-acetylmuramyl-(pentapeptide) pyrophosphoryl-undecaprenol N-acetylglucosamine transferase [Rhodobacter sp.]
MAKEPVIVTGGGTGGHLYPALAIIEAIQDVAEISYVGNPDRIEAEVIPQKGIPFFAIQSTYYRPGLLNRIGLALRLLLGTMKGVWLVLRLRPRLIIGVGGFVSVPMVLAGWLARRRLVLHEQNVGPGQANRFLGRIAGMDVLTTFPVEDRHFPKNEMFVTGCPVRQAFWAFTKSDARAQLGVPDTATVILVVGGSGGAPALNAAAEALTDLLIDRPDLVLLHGTGRRYFDEVSAKRDAMQSGATDRYKIYEYLDETAIFMLAADMIVSRSGASTLSEIFCSKLPSVLVPSPNVAENHQLANAVFASDAGAGVVVEEGPDFENRVREATRTLLGDDALRTRMAAAAAENCRGKDAGQNIRAHVLSLLERR